MSLNILKRAGVLLLIKAPNHGEYQTMQRLYTRSYIIILLVTVIISFLSVQVQADKKKYVWTIEYDTMPRGMAELEHYWTVKTPEFDRFSGNTTNELWLELEVGMNDHWDMRFYQVFEQEPNESLDYKGFKIETRYRLGEVGSNPLDQLIYIEYKNRPDFSRHVLELKYVFSKDFGPWNIAFNPILEIEEGEDEGEDTEFVPEYALGISHEMNRLLSLGIEFKGSESGHYVGPTVSHGSGRFWFASGALFGYADIEDGKPEFQLRTIFGVKF